MVAMELEWQRPVDVLDSRRQGSGIAGAGVQASTAIRCRRVVYAIMPCCRLSYCVWIG